MDYVELRISASDPAALELLYVDLEDMPVEAVEQEAQKEALLQVQRAVSRQQTAHAAVLPQEGAS